MVVLLLCRRHRRRVICCHTLKSTPQRRGVSSVRFVLQRPQDAAGDCGDIGIAGPASDGKGIRHLDHMPIRVGELVFGILKSFSYLGVL
jgi:hypothetical protein